MKRWNNPELKRLDLCQTKDNLSFSCGGPNPAGICQQSTCDHWKRKNNGNGKAGTCSLTWPGEGQLPDFGVDHS